MGTAEIVGFAIGWVLTAVVLTWALLTERRSGPGWMASWRRLRSSPPVELVDVVDLRVPPPPPATPADDWVVVETLDGTGGDVLGHGELLVAAALAARGLDAGALSRGDIRVETYTRFDGSEVTRFLVRSGVLSRSAPS